jgi:hypothetical protein
MVQIGSCYVSRPPTCDAGLLSQSKSVSYVAMKGCFIAALVVVASSSHAYCAVDPFDVKGCKIPCHDRG